MTCIIDSDQHLYESRSLWADYIDPSAHHEALSLVDDDLGYTWLSWHDTRLGLADVHLPGDTASCGDHRKRQRAGEPASYRYDDALPTSYWEPAARLRWLDEVGLDEAVVFPNFGLLWERRLSSSFPAVTANMMAWNRWCAAVRAETRGRLHPVAHLTFARPRVAAGGAGFTRSGGYHAGHDRRRTGGRPTAFPPRPRPDLVLVRRPRDHTGLPRRRSGAGF